MKDPEADLIREHGATKPTKNTDGEYDDFAIEEWKMEHKMFLDRKISMKSNIKKLYALVWRQCTQALKSEIMGFSDYNKNEKREIRCGF